MQGNVWEWCHDRYDKHYYEQSPSENPTGPTIGSTRVRRGGSWASDRAIFRAAYRSVESPGRDDVFDLGFRVLLELPAVQAPRAEEASSPASTK
jgi:formylglycine-generating enzyme required for sulfatase activity